MTTATSKAKNATEVTIAKNQWARYTRARDAGHLDYIQIAKKCSDYYRGEQWDANDKARLDAEGRPALTINTILSTINTILGHQATQRADVIFKPRKDTNQPLADVMTKVFKQIMTNNDFEFQESQMFADGVIQDRGYFDLRIDFDDNQNGEIRINVEDPIDILPDPDAKNYDPKTWTEFFKTRWLSLDEIQETYGKKKAETVEYYANSGLNYGKDSISFNDYTKGFGDTHMSNYRTDYYSESETKSVQSVRIIERQHRKLVSVDHFLRQSTGDMRPVPTMLSKDEAREYAEANGYVVTKKTIRRVRYTVTADNVVLHDDWSPYNDFTVIPYFPYFRRGKPFGMVRNLLSPQEQLNKIASQELHIVNTTANSGWIVESGALSNMDADELSERGSETGLVMVHNRGSSPPEKIQPNQIPTGLDRIAQKSQNNIKEISGITDALLGSSSPEVSGVALERNQMAGQVQIQIPMEHLRFTRQILARQILDLIQNFYTDERVFQITDEQDPLKTKEELTINQEDPVTQRIFNDLTIGEYDIVVGTAPARDTFDDMQFAQALQLRQAGVAIPDDIIVQYSQLHRKGELAKEIRMVTGREQTPEQQQISQMSQQIALQNAQLEVAKLQAEVEKLKADTQLAMAKAQTEGVQPQMELQKLQSDLQGRQQELSARMQMSQLSADSAMAQNEMSNNTKLATESIKAQSSLAQKELMNGASKNP